LLLPTKAVTRRFPQTPIQTYLIDLSRGKLGDVLASGHWIPAIAPALHIMQGLDRMVNHFFTVRGQASWGSSNLKSCQVPAPHIAAVVL
jgi:hypothetical protein